MALTLLLAPACRMPAPTPTTTPTTHSTSPPTTPPAPQPTPATSAPSPASLAPPAWLTELAPRSDTIADDGFLLTHTTHHFRVTRNDATLFTLASLGLSNGSILAAEPFGDAVVVWAYTDRRFAALLWTPTGTRPLATSDSAAFAVQGDVMLYTRGPAIIEHSLTNNNERTRQRFAKQAHITTLGMVGRDLLALVDTGDRKRNRTDIHLVGRPDPLLRDVHLNVILADRWSVHTNERGNLTVGEGGRFGPSTSEQPPDRCTPSLCIRSVRASAIVQLDATGRTRRLTPWIADPEQPAGAVPSTQPSHRITTLRGVDGSSPRWRAGPALPWRATTLEAPILAPATPTATDAAVIGERMAVLEPTKLRVFGPGLSEHSLDLPRVEGRLIADGANVTLASGTATRISIALDGPAPPAGVDMRLVHPPHTLEVRDVSLTLDGRDLPFQIPTDMRGDHGPRIDGLFGVPGAPTALLAIGRQSHHGGHYVHDRILALNFGDGSVRRVGPDGASPIGERTHQRFGVWNRLAIDATGRWLLMTTAKSIVLAPIDGSEARSVLAYSPPADLRPSISADGQRFAAIHNGRLMLGDFTGAMTSVRTPPLRDAWISWAPGGRAFVVVSRAGAHVIHDDGSVHKLACPDEISHIHEVLPDARAVLLGQQGAPHLATATTCSPIDGYQVVPRGQQRLETIPTQ